MAKASICAMSPPKGAGTASWYQSNRWIWWGWSELGTGFAMSHEYQLLIWHRYTHWAWLSQLSLSRGPISYVCSMLFEIRPSGVYPALPMWKMWASNIWLGDWRHCVMVTYCPSRPYEVPLGVSHPPKLGQLSFEPSRGAFMQALAPLVQSFV